MSDKQLISIESFRINTTNCAVSANFSEMRETIAKTIADNKSLITPETIQGGKTLAADFRKTSKALMAAWKERREISIADVIKADDEIKSLCKLLNDGADEISVQVKAIEAETKALCAGLLRAYLYSSWDYLAVDDEYRKTDIDDLIRLGSLTPKGELTKAVKSEIEQRCKLDKAQQDKIASRLKDLELRCLQADIVPPLSRASIDHFLYADDFEPRLESVIAAEVARKAEAERRMREKLEAEKQREIDAALKAQQDEANRIARAEAEQVRREELDRRYAEENKNAVPVKEAKPAPVEPIPDDAVTFVVTATIEIDFQAKPTANRDKIIAYFTDIFERDNKRVLSMDVRQK